MKKKNVVNKAGFTLLELLVVVLIIGILAAIALPQYKRSIAKARAMEAIINLKAISEAQKRYMLLYGVYTTNLNDLDITIQDSNYYSYQCIQANFSNKTDCYANNKKGYPHFEVYGETLFCRGTTRSCEPFNGEFLASGYWIIKPGSL